MALLEATAVTVQFGGVTAVDNASISVESGSITGLIGPNGAGKTTLFNVITGLQSPTKGRVRFRGQDVTRSTVNSRAKAGMGRTFQRLEAFGSLTVRENVLAAREIYGGVRSWFGSRQDKTVDELIDRVGIRQYAHQRADSVPTGVARLLEMARALAIEPRLLLLDEPSSGLDENETHAFGELLKDLAADETAILMVEHDMDLVMSVCELIHVLEFGKVIATGTPGEIRSDRTVQAAYLGFVDETSESAEAALHALDEIAGAVDDTRHVDDDTSAFGEILPAETTMELPTVDEEGRT
ncbi:MAG TPA: ABC transporter ATP-binding protein [Jatrophihabitantaceae bacterium]|nr:ABC transporter ATP-binding protein [Jatrophihabitantaceae bacterium]